MTCLSNLRQLGTAFIMYLGENKQTYPRPAVGGAYFCPEDWIYWEPSHDISDSAIAPYLGAKPTNPAVFRCPSDNYEVRPNGSQYFYSYSVNFLICRLPASGWPTTYSTYYGPGETNNCMKSTEIRNSSYKILIIDRAATPPTTGAGRGRRITGRGRTSFPTATTGAKRRSPTRPPAGATPVSPTATPNSWAEKLRTTRPITIPN